MRNSECRMRTEGTEAHTYGATKRRSHEARGLGEVDLPYPYNFAGARSAHGGRAIRLRIN